MTTNTEETKFTRYIRSKIEASEKSQRELAELVGYNNQNIVNRRAKLTHLGGL